MELRIKHIVLTAVFCLFSLPAISQFTEHPPEPMASTEDGGWEGCGEDGEPGTDPSVPPGLCMPIDDYVIPLLLVGMIFGAYRVHKLNSPQTT